MTAAARRKCEGGCGRWLTAPESLAVGMGRTCLRKAQGTPQGPSRARSAPPGPRVPPSLSRAATANPVPLCAGQGELPLVGHQPTLWSI